MINHTAQRLERDVAVESIEQVAQWLVQNALDAGADEILVCLHGAANNALVVEDNGCGISRADLDALCTPGSTSACTAHRSGRALANIGSVSHLCITSRPHGSFETVCKVMHQGHVARQGVAAVSRTVHGTTVEVHHLFEAVPVRARHQAAIGNARQRANVQRVVLQAAVFHPQVQFTIKQHAGGSAHQPTLQLAKGRPMTTTLMHLWALPLEALHPVHITTPHVVLHGVLAIPRATTHDPTMCVVWQQGDVGAVEVHEHVLMYLQGVLEAMQGRGRGAVSRKRNGGRQERKSVQRWPLFALHMQHNTPHDGSSFMTSNHSNRNTNGHSHAMSSCAVESWQPMLDLAILQCWGPWLPLTVAQQLDSYNNDDTRPYNNDTEPYTVSHTHDSLVPLGIHPLKEQQPPSKRRMLMRGNHHRQHHQHHHHHQQQQQCRGQVLQLGWRMGPVGHVRRRVEHRARNNNNDGVMHAPRPQSCPSMILHDLSAGSNLKNKGSHDVPRDGVIAAGAAGGGGVSCSMGGGDESGAVWSRGFDGVPSKGMSMDTASAVNDTSAWKNMATGNHVATANHIATGSYIRQVSGGMPVIVHDSTVVLQTSSNTLDTSTLHDTSNTHAVSEMHAKATADATDKHGYTVPASTTTPSTTTWTTTPLPAWPTATGSQSTNTTNTQPTNAQFINTTQHSTQQHNTQPTNMTQNNTQLHRIATIATNMSTLCTSPSFSWSLAPPPPPPKSSSCALVLTLRAWCEDMGTSAAVPTSITRHDLHVAQFLAQVDRRWLAVRYGNTIALIDQHGADERVRLECLTAQIRTAVQRGLPPSNSLPSPLRIHLTATETAVVAQYASQLHAWGWRWSNSAGGDAAGVQDGWEGVGVARQGVLLTHVPSVLGTCTNAADFKAHVAQLDVTCGSMQLPAAHVRLLASKACRTAIMFNTQLPQSRCLQLLHELKQTKHCFSCAHGRPTMVPLVDVEVFARAQRMGGTIRDGGICGNGGGSKKQQGCSIEGLVQRLSRLVHAVQ